MVENKYDFSQRSDELTNDFIATIEWLACVAFVEKLKNEQMERTITNYNGIKLETYCTFKGKQYKIDTEPYEYEPNER